MPIQYRCQACGQPIEVDDEAAEQLVCCPFCNKIGPAPAQSDPTIETSEIAELPEAPAAQPGASASELPAPIVSTGGNRLGWVALACVGVAVLSYAILMIVLASVALRNGPTTNMAQMQEEMQHKFEATPWMNVLSLLGGWMAPMAGFVCAIVSLARRGRPRWPAVTALCFSGALFFLVCLGGMMSLFLRAG